ncbi:hypothetical protein V499_08864 [Pseudogymnoascus sp. VKM F-103]|nr:hypothetical protein V499_08864 [Pseudogymnoascus sp. VKM F-103]
MQAQAPPYLFKETRINLDSPLSNSTVILRLPVPGASTRLARTQKRPLATEIALTEDENAFKSKHLASASSIYHRLHHTSPRSFHWRVLEDGKALSITAVDVCKRENGPENPLTLRLYFSSPIRPGCIAFADHEEHDTLSVLALTESNHLYTLTLRPDSFRRRASTENNVDDWCKIYLSTAFSFKHPHRLVARNPGEVLISLHDGGLLRLNRLPGEDASSWKETFYNEGGWAHGLRSLIPFQGGNTIKHGKINIELSAVTAIAVPKADIDGDNYAFTVSLDHRIRVWNLDSGKIAFTGDLLGAEREPNDLGKWVLHPSQAQLIRVFQDDERTTIVTFSPIGAGEFKFWTMTLNGDGTAELIDMFPEIVLKPSHPMAGDPMTDVWIVADFSATVHNDERGKLSLWVLWKNNITYRVQTVDITLLSANNTSSYWKNGWSAVATDTVSQAPLPVILPSDPEDATEKWLNYILYPGKYTIATVETALSIYERSLGRPQKISARGNKNLSERICAIIGSSIPLSSSSTGQIDYEHFKTAIDAQWRRFYRLIVELDKQRGEALALSFDADNQLHVVATANGLSVIRECSPIEELYFNPDNAFGGKSEGLSNLISAAATFRENFNDMLQHSCKAQLAVQLFQDPSQTDSEHLQSFYDRCNFAGQIGDDDFEQLLAYFGGSFKNITLGSYEDLFRAMAGTEDMAAHLERYPLASLGRKVAVKGVQEIVELHQSVCFDQLVLLAFIEGEIDQQEEGMQLDTAAVHRQLIAVLKHLEILEWLLKTQISISPLKTERSESIASISDAQKPEEFKIVTVFEGTVNHLLGLAKDSDVSNLTALTKLLGRVCDPNSEIELQPALIQAFLLKTEHADLAVSFSRFCSQDPFSVYMQGRSALAVKDLSVAANYFKKAAFGLGKFLPSSHISISNVMAAHSELQATDRHSSGLLNETDWNSLCGGLPSYYAHIASLFDSSKSHSYVIDFARLALQFLPTHSKVSPAQSKKDTALRADLLSRLFSSALHTARYELAHSTLHLMPDAAIQKSNLRSLVYSLCENSAAAELIELPFLGMHALVDEALSQKCASIVDVNIGVPWHKILYAWRIRRGDFRGAAAVAYQQLQKLQQLANGGHGKDLALWSGKKSTGAGNDELDTPVTRQYLQLINALSCVEPGQAWILAEPVGRKNGVVEKRRVITLEDARRGLQDEMDRVEGILRGRFSFVGGEERDVDMDED